MPPPRSDAGRDESEQTRFLTVTAAAQLAGVSQVILPTGRPVLRQGEALLVEWSGVSGWRNVGEDDALIFWILRDDPGPSRPPPLLRAGSTP